jgi:anti-sigma regulatory factor (Ser/Thr protein kinase)
MHHAQAAISITEASDVAEARRAATTLARRLGFDETRTGKVALVVTEAAGNLIKHTTQGGEVVLRSLQSDGISGLEMLGLDRGPGMPNLGECLRDGYSTAGSPGIGLGALVRLPDYFDIYSIPGIGTALLACLWAGPLPQATRPYSLDIGAVCLPIASEHACGDGWAALQGPERTLMLVVDGLGHGLLHSPPAGPRRA